MSRYEAEFEQWRMNIERMFSELVEEAERSAGRSSSRIEALKSKLNKSIEAAKEKFKDMTTNEPEVSISPATDIYETDQEVALVLDMPGVTKQDVQITFDRGELVVTGSRKKRMAEEKGSLIMEEIIKGDYKRKFLLPTTYDASATKAEVKNGLLTITVPKVKAAPPRKIEIE